MKNENEWKPGLTANLHITECHNTTTTENVTVNVTEIFFSSLDVPLVLLLLFMPGNGGTPFNEPSPLLLKDGAPLRDDSPPADFDA